MMKDPQEIRLRKIRQLIERSLRKRFDDVSVDEVLPYLRVIKNEEVLDLILIEYAANRSLHDILEKVISEIFLSVELANLEIIDVEQISDPYFPNVDRFLVEFEYGMKLKLLVRKDRDIVNAQPEVKYEMYADGVKVTTSNQAIEVAKKAKRVLIEKYEERTLQYLLLFDDLPKN